jgi:hypothetical protein
MTRARESVVPVHVSAVLVAGNALMLEPPA